MKLLYKPVLLVFIIVLAATSCKNKVQAGNENDTAKVEDTASAVAEMDMVQHNFPEKPEKIVSDTSFKIGKATYGCNIVKKTVDTSLVVFIGKVRDKKDNRLVKNVYMDYEYYITPKGPGYKGGQLIINKATFKKEFNEDFYNNSVLFKAEFVGFVESLNEFQLRFTITKPDTDFTYIIDYYVNNNGEVFYEILDV